MAGLFVRRVGRGPPVVLVHGAVLAGELCWRQQLPLADRFALEIVDRAGYGHSQRVSPGEDLDADAPLVAGLLAEGAHLVGQSSGAVAAMLAAAVRPEAVLSLTLCEPVAFQLVPGSAAAQRMAHDIEEHLRRPGGDAAWLRGFLAIVGRSVAVPDQLPPPLAQGVRAVRAVRRRPWEGELPVGQLAAASFPTLVISGQHSAAFEAVCDAMAARLQAQRAYVVGAGHARDRRCVQHHARVIHRRIAAAALGPAKQNNQLTSARATHRATHPRSAGQQARPTSDRLAQDKKRTNGYRQGHGDRASGNSGRFS